MFIVFEGIDGVGKTTQITTFCDWLRREQSATVWHYVDPGSTWIGKALRALLLDADCEMQPRTIMLLFAAARSELAFQIRAKLDAGDIVVCDRWVMSTDVYQGMAQHVGREDVRAVHACADYGVGVGDLIFVLDAEAETTMRRKAGLPPALDSCSAPDNCEDVPVDATDRFEGLGRGFRETIRQGYLCAAADYPTAVLVDATPHPDVVHRRVTEIYLQRIQHD